MASTDQGMSPAGAAARHTGPFAGDIPDVNGSLGFWYYNTNKRSAVLDLEGRSEDRDAFLEGKGVGGLGPPQPRGSCTRALRRPCAIEVR